MPCHIVQDLCSDGRLPGMGLPWIAQLLLCIFQELLPGGRPSPSSAASAAMEAPMAHAGGAPPHTQRQQALGELRRLPLLPLMGGGFGCAADQGSGEGVAVQPPARSGGGSGGDGAAEAAAASGALFFHPDSQQQHAATAEEGRHQQQLGGVRGQAAAAPRTISPSSGPALSRILVQLEMSSLPSKEHRDGVAEGAAPSVAVVVPGMRFLQPALLQQSILEAATAGGHDVDGGEAARRGMQASARALLYRGLAVR